MPSGHSLLVLTFSPPIAGTIPLLGLFEGLGLQLASRRTRGQAQDVLFLRRDARLREIVLQVLDASQCHDAFALRGTAAEWFRGLVRRVHVRVERELAARACTLAAWRVTVGGTIHGVYCDTKTRGNKASEVKDECKVQLVGKRCFPVSFVAADLITDPALFLIGQCIFDAPRICLRVRIIVKKRRKTGICWEERGDVKEVIGFRVKVTFHQITIFGFRITGLGSIPGLALKVLMGVSSSGATLN